ncbi:MAG: hypothetical protein U1E73_10475 [Planctomycetota bacterium]
MPTPSAIRPRCLLALGFLIACHGCVAGDEIQTSEHRSILPALRVRWDMRAGDPPGDGRFAYRPGVEFECTDLRGDDDGGGDFAFRVTQASLLFEPELLWHNVRATPIVGLTYNSFAAEESSVHVGSDSAGLAAGVGIAWTGWDWLEPYLRYTEGIGAEFSSNRFEVGLGVPVAPRTSLQVAWSRQAATADDLRGGWFLPATDTATVRADGVAIGIAFRF